MLSMIEIENFKSIEKLTLNPGRVNVFIGENGSGKSNILEAIGFAAAAEANKLDNEFLVSRGIRVSEPQLMRSGFSKESQNHSIKISLSDPNPKLNRTLILNADNIPFSKWNNFPIKGSSFQTPILLKKLVEHPEVLSQLMQLPPNEKIEKLKAFQESINDLPQSAEGQIENFLIYSPENTALRNFYKEGQIEPLGINGEGLLKLLKVIKENTPEKLEIINEALELFGWYEALEIPSDIHAQESKVQIKDRFINGYFDQRSANEGFLFILFYTALMVSEDTPKIFAVDNIDASLNPKLCTKLISMIAELAERFDKQVFLTGHNPAILDGLNLTDENQKLFVISRNKKGHTRAKQIGVDSLPVSSSGEPLKLSEAMLRGYIGGLPKSF